MINFLLFPVFTCVSPLVLYEISPHVVRLATPSVRTDEHLLAGRVHLDLAAFTPSCSLLWVE